MAESEIPDDIMKAAWQIAEHCNIMSLISQRAGIIAEALLSERRQCADIAYDAALYSGCPADFIAEEIAEAVRNGERRQPMRPSR